jgi:hypothetical protein
LIFKRDKEKTIEHWKHFLKETPKDVQYNQIKKAIALLEQDDFVLPDISSDVSLEEALMLGGKTLEAEIPETRDQTADHEGQKTQNSTEGLLDSVDENEL